MAATAQSAKPVITYFNIRGRAEVIRLIFEELGIEYEDRRITDAGEWQALACFGYGLYGGKMDPAFSSRLSTP